ncbi:hypothetical protein [Enterococcus sp. HY326]|uniref:hypothetical protein n=1 Tax=Enterococcus sp. HY326 TaxID=2971265 RepID=UPI00224090E8|nr:hypothetical protein [Enterococcus sp. HY326]
MNIENVLLDTVKSTNPDKLFIADIYSEVRKRMDITDDEASISYESSSGSFVMAYKNEIHTAEGHLKEFNIFYNNPKERGVWNIAELIHIKT